MSEYIVPQPQTNNILDMPAYNPSPAQLKMLAESGISEKTANVHKLRCIPAGNGGLVNLQEILNRAWLSQWGECLLIPYFDEHGNVILWRVKPENDHYDSKGNPCKYLSPKGANLRIYFPAGVLFYLKNRRPSEQLTVFITEGEKKALSLYEQGKLAIGLPGVDTWHKPKSKFKLHSDLQQLDWKGVNVSIVFDSDAEHNDAVKTQRSRLAQALTAAGAEVKVLSIPDSASDPDDFNGAKVGVDDLIVKLGKRGFEEFLNNPSSYLAAEKPPIGKQNFEDVTEQFRDSLAKPVKYWSKRVYARDDNSGRYVAQDEDALKSESYKYLKENYTTLKESHAKELVSQLKLLIGGPSANPPCWLGETPDPDFTNLRDECLVTKQSIIHLPTRRSLPNTPYLFATSAIDVTFDPNAPEPARWLQHLDEVFGGDKTQIKLLQQFCGYMLTARMPHRPDRGSLQKILMILGPSGVGKGVIIRVIRSVIGDANVAAPTMDSLDQRFGAGQLVGKSLIVVQDMKLRKGKGSLALERINNISGEDLVNVEYKGDPELINVSITAKIVLVTNEFPHLDDNAKSLSRRLIPLQAVQHDRPKIDGLADMIFTKEAAGILNWITDGWRDLCDNGFAALPPQSLEIRKIQEQLNSPIAAFIEEECEVGVGYRVPFTDLFCEWQAWCMTSGHHPGSKQSFGAKFHAQMPQIGTERPRQPGRGQAKHYVGIRLKHQRHESERKLMDERPSFLRAALEGA